MAALVPASPATVRLPAELQCSSTCRCLHSSPWSSSRSKLQFQRVVGRALNGSRRWKLSSPDRRWKIERAFRGGRSGGTACSVLHSGTAAAKESRISPREFNADSYESFLLELQEKICAETAEADGSCKEFIFDKWHRGSDPSAGYGITRVLEEGDLLEKAAANVSIIRGTLSMTRAQAMSSRGKVVAAGTPYFAGALSLVFHPRNPHVPTFRADIRYFQVEGSGGWFGGGADLTPCYLYEQDAQDFHHFWQEVCDLHHPTLYHRSKALCDKYFYIPARKEHRGIGGIFFDDLDHFADNGSIVSPGTETAETESMERASSTPRGGKGEADGIDEVFAFVKEVGEGFLPSYLPIAERRRKTAFGEREREWQLVRRGRYLEFNLLYDRGVRFGLDGGRVESIMVSAPPLIAWKYNRVPEEGSREAELVEVLRRPRDWAG